MNVVPLDTLTLARLTELLNTSFRTFAGHAAEMPLVLAQVVPGPATNCGGLQYESFSLVFHGPEKPLLPQGTRRFEHDHLGSFDLFIVPIGQEAGLTKYEAVFNRLVRPA